MVAAIAIGAGSQAGAAMPGLYFSGFYMDSSLAYSTADVNESVMESWRSEIWDEYGFEALGVDSSGFDRTDIGYSFGVGFQYSEYLAAELAYVQMGEARYTAIGPVGDPGGAGTALSRTQLRTRARGLGISGIGAWPLGDRWALDARAGLLWGKNKVSYTVELQGGGYDDGSLKGDSWALMLGAGVNFSMSPGTAIRVGYTRLQEALYGDRNADSWVLGLKYAW